MSTRRRIGAIVLCTALVGGACVAVAAVQGHSEVASSTSDDSGGDLADTADDAVQGCANSWNERNQNKGNVASIATAAQQSEDPTAYVSVGFSDLFPDRCMITIANPSTLYAQQYLQEAGSAWSMIPAWTGMANQIDSSLLPWNGRMTKSGVIIIL
ncbi:hypothetical protein OG786_20845 [Streptomyces sp. NBC_00101]|uniref:hypothetical protein n=1 Tax=Streptomyces sp. NBC_00101 TaxID=2975651 RepID=UPI00324D21CD